MTLPRAALLFFALALAAGCRSASTQPAAPPTDRPYVLVLGTAQDGGLPQLGCQRPCCQAARQDPARRRLTSSLLLVDPRSGARWLFDAGPDLPEQVELARGHGRGGAAPQAGRPALFDGIFLTHAHMGHYAGLLHLGREAYGTASTPVHASPRLCSFLARNGPWSLLVSAGHLEPRPLLPEQPLQLAPDLSVTALPVPHRDEFSDTYAFLIRGPGGAALYLPDIDKWERWERDLEQVLGQVDAAFLDATFFGPDELPGRAMAEVPHPFVVETLARLEHADAATRAKVRLIHLNHSNPAADPASPAARQVREAGLAISREGDLVPL